MKLFSLVSATPPEKIIDREEQYASFRTVARDNLASSKAGRKKIVEFASSSVALEGLVISSKVHDLAIQYENGEIDLDELIKRARD
ncbi:antitoxin VbhA family protein [Xanthomonas arboricola]|uniref:antitoxin VbhA family protein n=1 Tax=Xanthomonas arboricola TaxID=56448 RepID=UPI000E0F72F8|nr:antitoxin VbhA family protein [Xanthomonas arboricola]